MVEISVSSVLDRQPQTEINLQTKKLHHYITIHGITRQLVNSVKEKQAKTQLFRSIC